MNSSLQIRLANPTDAIALHDIRTAAIRELSITHLSEQDAAAWAERGGIRRVERAIANDEVWVAVLRSQIAGWLHRAVNSIEGLYVSPKMAGQGIATALVELVEERIARGGHPVVVLESSLNAAGFYLRRGYLPTEKRGSASGLPMRKPLATK